MAKTTATTAKDRASAKTAAAAILARLGYRVFMDYDEAEKIAAVIVTEAIRDSVAASEALASHLYLVGRAYRERFDDLTDDEVNAIISAHPEWMKDARNQEAKS